MARILPGNRHPAAVVTPLASCRPTVNPATVMASFPDCAWGLILLAAVGMCLDGSVGTAWLLENGKCTPYEDGCGGADGKTHGQA